MIVGKLLSDGWLEKYSKNSNVRFRFKQSIKQTNYVIHSFMILSHYSSNIPNLIKNNRKGQTHYSVLLSTRLLPCFNELYTLFYKNKVKVIPDNIYDLLTPLVLIYSILKPTPGPMGRGRARRGLALAHWIMGDGASLNKGLVLCTDSYTLQEVVLLMNVLKIKYDINSSIQGYKKGRPRIYILSESMPKLRKLVNFHMLPSIMYKLNKS